LLFSVCKPLLVKAAPQVTRTANTHIFANQENGLLFILKAAIQTNLAFFNPNGSVMSRLVRHGDLQKYGGTGLYHVLHGLAAMESPSLRT
jgi:hypothetical protein